MFLMLRFMAGFFFLPTSLPFLLLSLFLLRFMALSKRHVQHNTIIEGRYNDCRAMCALVVYGLPWVLWQHSSEEAERAIQSLQENWYVDWEQNTGLPEREVKLLTTTPKCLVAHIKYPFHYSCLSRSSLSALSLHCWSLHSVRLRYFRSFTCLSVP